MTPEFLYRIANLLVLTDTTLQPPTADSPFATYLLILGLLLINLWLFMRLRSRRHRKAGEATSQERIERNKQLGGMRTDLEELMVEIEQMAKRLGAQLDAKAIQLEHLIEDADKKIGQARQSNATIARPQQQPSQPSDPLARSVYELADQGVEPTDIAQKLDEHIGKVELILALRGS